MISLEMFFRNWLVHRSHGTGGTLARLRSFPTHYATEVAPSPAVERVCEVVAHSSAGSVLALGPTNRGAPEVVEVRGTHKGFKHIVQTYLKI